MNHETYNLLVEYRARDYHFSIARNLKYYNFCISIIYIHTLLDNSNYIYIYIYSNNIKSRIDIILNPEYIFKVKN